MTGLKPSSVGRPLGLATRPGAATVQPAPEVQYAELVASEDSSAPAAVPRARPRAPDSDLVACPGSILSVAGRQTTQLCWESYRRRWAAESCFHPERHSSSR